MSKVYIFIYYLWRKIINDIGFLKTTKIITKNMATIKAYIDELDGIETELKKLRVIMKKLNARKKELHQYISDYLEEKDQPGLKYNGRVIMLDSGKMRKPKKKKEKEVDCKDLIRRWGIDDTDDFYEELMDSMRGESYTKNKIKIKRLE